MRIALFTDTYLPQVNGVSQTLGRLVTHAIGRGHDVAVISPRLPDCDGHASLKIDLPGLAAPFYPQLRLALPLDPWNARKVRAFDPHIVHVATEFTVGWSGTTFAADSGLPLVTSFHTDFPAYLAGYGLAGLEAAAWRLLASFHDRAGLTFCPSSATLAQLREAGFHDRLRIWRRGVDATAFHPSRRTDEVRRRWAPGADVILLFVGRLAPEKRTELLLGAFRELRSRWGPGLSLLIVGDGPDREELEAQAGPGVVFTGFRTGTELADLYAAADVFAFPSDTETFGNVVLEAMASGLPVVTADRGGVVDSVTPGVTGALFPAGDAGAFGRELERLIETEEARRRMGAAAREYAVTRGWADILDSVLDGYAELVAEQSIQAA
ncbi:MAG: glycosyltransferase family 1 protein [Longimicrobiales bacterium]